MSQWKVAIVSAIVFTIGAVLIDCSSGNLKTNTSATQAAFKTTDSTISPRVGTAEGSLAPDFQLTRMDGSSVSLADLRGQPAVLIFWTAWCPICKEEAPHFNELAAQYEPKGVRMLGINIQDSPARTEGGIRDFGIRYTVARDPDASVAHRYNVTGTPTIIILDGNGVVRYYGNELPADFNSRLEALLIN